MDVVTFIGISMMPKVGSKMILYSHVSIVKISSNISCMYAMSSSLYPQSADLAKNTDNF